MGHCYSVLDYDASTDTVKVRNPWGKAELLDEHGRVLDGVDDGLFKVSFHQFQKLFTNICYEKAKAEDL